MDESAPSAGTPQAMRLTMTEAAELAGRFHQDGRLAAAAEVYRQLIAHDPDDASLHVCLSQVLLAMGDFEAGWREYEWRWALFEKERPPYPRPKWDGSPLAGETIFVHGEQGYGDNIQFIRYAPLVAACGGRVVFGSPPGLRPLAATAAGIAAIVEPGEPIPPFDAHIPLASLPGVLGTRLATIPAEVPYLRAEEGRIARWRRRFAAKGGRLSVGICWQANPKFAADRFRSLPLSHLLPLFDVPGVDFYGLQVLHGREQMAPLDPALPFEDIGRELYSPSEALVEAAAAIAALDLVITVDTAICHLAGALARPAWVLLSLIPDWRWLTEREDCPWYPTLRLFRQRQRGDWDGVVRRVVDGLGEAVAGR